jgi:hypothetical protein
VIGNVAIARFTAKRTDALIIQNDENNKTSKTDKTYTRRAYKAAKTRFADRTCRLSSLQANLSVQSILSSPLNVSPELYSSRAMFK